MQINGIPNSNGTYTITVAAKWRWLRRLTLFLFAIGFKDEILTRDDRHIIFDRSG